MQTDQPLAVLKIRKTNGLPVIVFRMLNDPSSVRPYIILRTRWDLENRRFHKIKKYCTCARLDPLRGGKRLCALVKNLTIANGPVF